ncbi:hypothetical protein ONJ87_26965, partial [Salmonella enterica subsp. enterica serovar Anatum]|nr:hypothetical protein [Salmonella enterica subsp. enterica serovar Anatum]
HADSVKTPFHFFLINNDEINAFAFFGGNVVLHSALFRYADNEKPVGPRPFPLGIIGLMALCALALLLRHPDTVSWPRRHVLQKL